MYNTHCLKASPTQNQPHHLQVQVKNHNGVFGEQQARDISKITRKSTEFQLDRPWSTKYPRTWV